ncbi:MAG TPA: TRIC cation channel family protein [Streptosporangiaceae bacterium]
MASHAVAGLPGVGWPVAGLLRTALPAAGGLATWVDLAAVFAAAVLGGQVAAEKNLDPVGFTALAIISGLGGGILRDVLLQHGPPLALVHPSYLITAVIAAAVAFFFDLQRYRFGRAVLLLVNALGLSFWAVSGSERATAAGLGIVSCLLLGTCRPAVRTFRPWSRTGWRLCAPAGTRAGIGPGPNHEGNYHTTVRSRGKRLISACAPSRRFLAKTSGKRQHLLEIFRYPRTARSRSTSLFMKCLN